MKTAKEILEYLQAQLDVAYKEHNETKRNEDKAKAYSSLVKIVMLEQIIEDIK